MFGCFFIDNWIFIKLIKIEPFQLMTPFKNRRYFAITLSEGVSMLEEMNLVVLVDEWSYEILLCV